MASPRKKCIQCEKSKLREDFRLVSASPRRYSKTCLLCLKKSDTPDTPEARKQEAQEIEYEQQFVRELASRELARRRMRHFVCRFEPDYKVGWVHQDLCWRLERFMKAVEEGKSPRLMLFMPPRHGKSTLASDYFPSFVLGHHPDWSFIEASYAVSLPIDFSHRIRARLRDPAYHGIFHNARLDPNKQSVERWTTTAGGGFIAAGVGSGISGKGAHVLVIDDPFADSEDADSQAQRDKVYNWYLSTAYTRLAPGGGVILIMTRWDDDDLAGRLLLDEKRKEEEGIPVEQREPWEIVKYPAIAEDDEYKLPDGRIVNAVDEEIGEKARLLRRKGEALHEARYDITQLLRIKATQTPRWWNAMFQQDPVPSEGEFFKKADMRYYDPHTIDLRGGYSFIAGDLAISEKKTADWTVLVAGTLMWTGDLYIREILRSRESNLVRIAYAFIAMCLRYDPMECGFERGQLEQALMPVLRPIMTKKQVSPPFSDKLTPVTNKRTRAQPLRGWTQQGRILFPEGQPWVEPAVSELLRFDAGLHDDVVDAMAWLVRMAKEYEVPVPYEVSANMRSWKDDLHKFTGEKERDFMAA